MHHDHARGVEISLEVNGASLTEYRDLDAEEEDAGENVNATRFVEIVPGANFSIRLRFHTNFIYPNDTIHCNYYLDGTNVMGRCPTPKMKNDYEMHGVEEGTCLQKFQFSGFETNDGPADGDPTKLKEFGTIVVRMVRCVIKTTPSPATPRVSPANLSNPSGFVPVGGDVVPEKMLKGQAISARTTLAEPENCKLRKRVRVEHPYGPEPFAVFTFKYRSRSDLKRQGVIPLSPSEIPLEQRDRATLNNDELRQLLADREQELKDALQIKKEKRERTFDTLSDDDCTVVEERPKRHRTAPRSKIQVVDLTDD